MAFFSFKKKEVCNHKFNRVQPSCAVLKSISMLNSIYDI